MIAQSQEFIYSRTPEIAIPLNPLKIINGMRLVRRLRYNPEGRTLEEVIPQDLYARFSSLLLQYPLADMEKVRPYFAADGIRGMAVLHNMLTEDHGVDGEIRNLANSNASMKQTRIQLGPASIDYDFLKQAADELESGASLADEIRCLEMSVTSIENDIAALQARARAWEVGDMSGLLENRSYQHAVDTCRNTWFNMDAVSDAVDEFSRNWLAAAEQALHSNESTFAVLELDQLIGPEGLVEKLRRKGYSVIAP